MSAVAVTREVVVPGMSAVSVFVLAEEWCRRCGSPCSYHEQVKPRRRDVSCGRCGYRRTKWRRGEIEVFPRAVA